MQIHTACHRKYQIKATKCCGGSTVVDDVAVNSRIINAAAVRQCSNVVC